jgi:hypothetical protein
MADKQAQALERLIVKLSAIRKTVRGEERALLDQMVLGARFQFGEGRKQTAPSEVELHMKQVGSKDVGAKSMEASSRAMIDLAIEKGSYKSKQL